jgi:signal transduction histidine kinase
VLALGLALLTGGTMLLLTKQLDSDISATLSERADAQLAALARSRGRTVATPGADRGGLAEQSWVFDERGRELLRPPAPGRVERAARGLAAAPEPVERDVGNNVRLRAEPAHRDGRRIGTVVVGVALRPYDHTEHVALLAMLILDACILALGVLVARRVVGKALQPVADMTAQADDWSEHHLDRRFGLGPPRDELTALSATLDHLLARIESSLRHEQRFSAEMAHELRTPLSFVRGEAELALREPATPPETRRSLEHILQGTERMQAVIETLLVAARRELAGAEDVSDALAATRAAVEAADADGSRIQIETGQGELWVGAEARLVEQALQPLLANAVRHARVVVTVQLERDDGHVLVHVLDDGEGIDPDEVEHVFAPGNSASGGAGLGLPLARRLARAAGGDVVAMAGNGGHLVLRLPAAG